MEKIIWLFPMVMMILLGIAIGMYISSQIKCHIRRNIFNKNVEEYEKKKTKQ